MPENNRKLHVFLCHSSQDKPIVRELYQRLLAEGWIDPWLDEEKLLPGQDWDLEIEKAVETADAVIVCLSNNSVTKEGYVQKEIRRALDKAEEKPEEVIFIIPLRVEECSIPRRLKNYQYQDFYDINLAYSRLYKSLENRARTLGVDIVEILSNLQKQAEERRIKEVEDRIRKDAEARVRREEEIVIRMRAEDRARKMIERKALKDAKDRASKEIDEKRNGEEDKNLNIHEQAEHYRKLVFKNLAIKPFRVSLVASVLHLLMLVITFGFSIFLEPFISILRGGLAVSIALTGKPFVSRDSRIFLGVFIGFLSGIPIGVVYSLMYLFGVFAWYFGDVFLGLSNNITASQNDVVVAGIVTIIILFIPIIFGILGGWFFATRIEEKT